MRFGGLRRIFGQRRLPREETADGFTLAHAGIAAVCALALFVFFQAVYTAADLRTDLPYYDEWASVVDYARLKSGDYGLSDWFSQHNEHRPMVPRLVLFADLEYFGGRNYLHPFVNVVLQLVETALLTGAAFFLFRGRAGGARLLVLSAATALALQFTLAQIETFIIPFQVLWTIGYTAGTAALAALAGAAASRGERRSVALAALAIILAAAAQLSVANGVWVWPLLVALGAWLRLPRSWLAVIAAAGIALTVLYFLDYARPADSQDPTESLSHPIRVVDYILIVLGGPVVPLFDRAGARILGALGVALIALTGWDAFRRRQLHGPASSFLLAQIIFSSLTVGLIAAGRAPLGIGSAEAPRYTMPAASLWTSLLILGWHSSAWQADPRLLRQVTTVVAALMVVVAAACPWKAAEPWEEALGGLERTSDAVRVGVYDDEAMIRIYPAPADIRPFVSILESYDLSVFHGDDPSELLGLPLGERFGVADNLCIGFFDAVLPAGSADGAAVAGWAWDTLGKRKPALILIVAPDDTITGVATATVERVDVIATVDEVTSPTSGWFGYSRVSNGPAVAYAVLDERVACRLTGEHDVVPGAAG